MKAWQKIVHVFNSATQVILFMYFVFLFSIRYLAKNTTEMGLPGRKCYLISEDKRGCF